ncbi:hypothetical protein [Minwuia thermotolerans]|uniref:Uncharacterized protein n=1 Tax=Minwuia thermotolerans TaxID=2056226 RepID=A0A2M9FXK1_9PROT|nr:hypothetical protein [Minwuia thermotolerans]PJK28191.1 hypothetical protein CVT23_17585 [Minwuia thermotolerans]
MYYLLIAVAATVVLPTTGEKLETVTSDGLPHAVLTDYDERRIAYKAREWSDDLGEETRLHVGVFDNLESCKSYRADLRLALRDAKLADRIRSNCFESRPEVETRTAGDDEEANGEGAD